MHSPNGLRTFRYRVVDVFTEHALEGNPLAVFPDASGLDTDTMQKIAREFNLSETTFVLPATRPDCVATVRIFTPSREMPFAGHPTIGTSFVLLDIGMVPENRAHFTVEEKIGPIPVRAEPGANGRPLIWLTTPAISFAPAPSGNVCAQALGLDSADLLDVPPEMVSAGNPGIFVALRNKDAVDRAWFDSHGAAILKSANQTPMLMFVFTPTKDGAYSRMFAPQHGVREDPATGSATGPLAAYMMRHGLAPTVNGTRLTSEQGTKMGRRSILHILVHGERGVDGIEVGGYVTPLAAATMTLPAEARHDAAVR